MILILDFIHVNDENAIIWVFFFFDFRIYFFYVSICDNFFYTEPKNKW
jgi:hypothetical protein